METLLNYRDITSNHNTRKKLNSWINNIYRFFWTHKCKYFTKDQIIREIKTLYYNPISNPAKKISGPEFRYCIKFIRQEILVRKINLFFDKYKLNKKVIEDIPESYLKSLFWIAASSRGYIKTYDRSVMDKHLKALHSRLTSLFNDMNSILKLKNLYHYVENKGE